MKKILLISLFILVACSSTEEIVEPEAIPELVVPEPEVPEPIVLDPEVVEEPEPENRTGEVEKDAIPDNTLTGVSCNKEALTFTITNTADKTWSLDLLTFPPPKDKDLLQITINGYDPWNPGTYFSQTSLRDCTDAIVEPGDTFSCTVKPISVIKNNAYSQNTIQAQANRINEQEHFECG